MDEPSPALAAPSPFLVSPATPYTQISLRSIRVLCLLRNLTTDLFPQQDLNSVYLASKPLLNSCLSLVAESSSHG
jgi:hypothetical protein